MKSLLWASAKQIKKNTNTDHHDFMEKVSNIAWWAHAFNSWHCLTSRTVNYVDLTSASVR